MKHGEVLQKRSRNYKPVKVGFFWSWYYEYLPDGQKRLCEKKVPKYDYVPNGWTWYGPTFRYRYDPVPGVKHWKNSIRSYYRHVRTTQEIRRSFIDKEYVRVRRTKRYLPDVWDDEPCYARREKGWKRTKKKRQWMKKGDKLYEKRVYTLVD